MDSYKKYLPLIFTFFHVYLWSQDTTNLRTLFQQGIISTTNVEYGCTFSADGNEIYFVRSKDLWGSSNAGNTIYHSKKISGQWSEPEIAGFSGKFNDSDPFLSPDGKRLYFISDRANPQTIISQDIWYVEKSAESGWSSPKWLAEGINSDAREYSPRTDGSGNLYFASDRDTGMGQGDLFMASLEGDHFQEPENLGNSVNSSTGEWNLDISVEGDILIFEASGREENLSPYGDLYISFKEKNSWSESQNIKELNTAGSDLYPLLEKNGSILYFASSDSLKSKTTNIYMVPFKKILESYRRKMAIPHD